MGQTLDRHINREIFGLWALEAVIIAVAFYGILLNTVTPIRAHGAFDLYVFRQATVFSLTISLTSVAIGLYRSDICSRRRMVMTTALITCVLLTPILGGLSYVLGLGVSLDPNSTAWLPKILAVWVCCLGVTRIGFHLLKRYNLIVRNIVVVGAGQSAVRIQNMVQTHGGGFFRVVSVLPPGAGLSPRQLAADKCWGVILADDVDGPTRALAGSLQRPRRLQVFGEAAFYESRLQRLDIDDLPPRWQETVARAPASAWFNVASRALDLAVSLTILALTAPLMALVAVAIRVESAGPVFYQQERVGLNGRTFMLRKFRSMSIDAEKPGRPVWAIKNDPRVTRVGRFMRRTRIDELPQLFNVLFGEMSLIGPRPERPHFVEHLSQVIPAYNDRACLKPGVTGWAQVKFTYGASIEDARMKLAYDLYYVKHRSVLFNLVIIVATIRVIVFQEGSR